MKKKIIVLVPFLIFSVQPCFADTSTDKIVTVPMPKFTQQPITVESQLKPNSPQPSIQVQPDSQTNVVVVKPVEVLVQPPAFDAAVSNSGNTDSSSTLAPEVVKPVTLTPEPEVKREITIIKPTQASASSTTTLEPTASTPQPYTLPSVSGPGALWKFAFLFALFFALLIAENRIRVKRVVNKAVKS